MMIAKLTGESYKYSNSWSWGFIVEVIEIKGHIWTLKKGEKITSIWEGGSWKITILSFNDYLKLLK